MEQLELPDRKSQATSKGNSSQTWSSNEHRENSRKETKPRKFSVEIRSEPQTQSRPGIYFGMFHDNQSIVTLNARPS